MLLAVEGLHVTIDNTILFKSSRCDAGMRLEKLDKMIGYTTGNTCLRNYILRYFGEVTGGKCMNCSACNGVETSVDITVEGQIGRASCRERVYWPV